MGKWSGYRRFCSLARGLDIVGERWTLLIVQEISSGPIRYNELRRRLPGIGSNVLADRLRKLEDHDVIRRVPAAVGQGVRYELTDRGERLTPALVELRKWGISEQLMLETPADEVVHDLSYGIPPDVDLNETYEWNIDGARTTLEIKGVALTQRPGKAARPAVIVKTTTSWMIDLVSGRTNWNEGREQGLVKVTGTDEAWQRMLIATGQPGADLAQVVANPRA